MTSERKGVLLVAAAAVLWSAGGLGIREVHETPLAIAAYRSLAAGLALLVLLRPRLPRLTPAFALGAVSYAALLVSFVLAASWTSVANAIFLQYCGVLWVLLLAPVVLREPFQRRDALAVGLAFVGMLLFFVGKFGSGGLAGEVAALISSAFFSILILTLRGQNDAAPATITVGNFLAFAALFPFLGEGRALEPRSALVLGLLGALQIGLAYALFVRGLRHVSATQASLVGMLEPVLSPIWVLLVVGEDPGGWSIAGGAIVLAAVAWRTLAPAARPPTAAP